jgi:hypothetical protein
LVALRTWSRRVKSLKALVLLGRWLVRTSVTGKVV